jgi:hypothetical protein
MSAQPVEHPAVAHIRPGAIDPNSAAGKAAAKGVAQLLGDVADRLEREGQPIPHSSA